MTINDIEAIRAVRDSENQLSALAGWWKFLPEFAKPTALRAAVWNLVVLTCHDPMQGELRIKSTAETVGIPVDGLRSQIRTRAEFLELPIDNRTDEWKELLCQLMLD